LNKRFIIGISTQIDFVADKEYIGSRDALHDLRIPLRSKPDDTFLRALRKESGRVTEKTIKKTSVPG
jgi:hypothetical protein